MQLDGQSWAIPIFLVMMRHAFPWRHQSELAWTKCCFGWRIQHWITTLQFRKTMETSLWHFFCSWLLTSSIVCLILSKIIPSISTTAFTALRVAGLLEPVKPIKMKTLGEHAKAIQKDPGSHKKKKSRRWQSEPLLCRVALDSVQLLFLFVPICKFSSQQYYWWKRGLG